MVFAVLASFREDFQTHYPFERFRALSDPEHAHGYGREEWARYELEMSAAPSLCRESMRSRLPVGWSAAQIALGRSESGTRYRTWTVSGWTTITHADGTRRRYEYRCDLAGSTVIGLMLTDTNGREEFLVPDVAP